MIIVLVFKECFFSHPTLGNLDISPNCKYSMAFKPQLYVTGHPLSLSSFVRICLDAGPLTHSGATALLYVCLFGLLGLFSGPYVELHS